MHMVNTIKQESLMNLVIVDDKLYKNKIYVP